MQQNEARRIVLGEPDRSLSDLYEAAQCLVNRNATADLPKNVRQWVECCIATGKITGFDGS